MTEKDKAGFSDRLKTVFYLICLAAVLVFVVYHLARMMTSDVITVRASERITSESISFSGILCRDEEFITGAESGVVYSEYPNGTKLKDGEHCIDIYPPGKADDIKRLSQLRRKHDLLLCAMKYATEEEIGGNLSLSYTDLMRKYSSGSSDIEGEIDALTLALTSRAYLFDKSSASAELERTKSEINSVIAGLGSPSDGGKMPFSGYIFTDGDRNGERFPASLALYGTADEIFSAIDGYRESEKDRYPSAVAAQTHEWYILASVSQSELSDFEKGTSYSARVGGVDLSAYVSDIREGDDGKSALVLYFDEIPTALTFSREIKVELTSRDTGSYRIPSSAIRTDDDGVTGVYVVSGGVVVFRRIEIIKSSNGYVLARSEREYNAALGSRREAEDLFDFDNGMLYGIYRTDSGEGLLIKDREGDTALDLLAGADGVRYKYLEENELIIIFGRELYEGKILG